MYSTTVAENKEHIYRLRAGQQPEVWILCVQDPTVVLECLRREFNTTRDIAIFFLRRGTPFTLAFEGIHPNVPPLSPIKQTRPSDFIPTSAHFLEWENTAREFMQTPRVSFGLEGRRVSSGGWLCISSERQSLRLPCLIWLRVLLLTMSLRLRMKKRSRRRKWT